jgi:hypothetical protein
VVFAHAHQVLWSLGALSMLALQAFQPSIQQIVTYPTNREATQQPAASISRSVGYYYVDGLPDNCIIMLHYSPIILLILIVKRTYPVNPLKAGVYNDLYDNETSLSESACLPQWNVLLGNVLDTGCVCIGRRRIPVYSDAYVLIKWLRRNELLYASWRRSSCIWRSKDELALHQHN